MEEFTKNWFLILIHNKKLLTQIIFILVFIVFPLILFGQNLVSNPSFEEKYNCPSDYTIDPNAPFLPGWEIPTSGTSDYFNPCSRINVGVPNNFMGTMYAAHGNAYVGAILFETQKNNSKKEMNYREFIQSELFNPLEKDSLYEIRISFAIAPHSTFAVNRFGISLTNKKLKSKKQIFKTEPQLIIDTIDFPVETGVWYELCDTFTSKNNEQFVTIGNFYSDEETVKYKLDISAFRNSLQEKIEEIGVAYYYIDKISIIKLP